MSAPFPARSTTGRQSTSRALLGTVLVHGTTSGRIVETEAYLGLADAASHASRGPTPRTKSSSDQPGHTYVYLIYGIHDCLNIVAEPEGSPGLRADPRAGAAERDRGPMRERRGLLRAD